MKTATRAKQPWVWFGDGLIEVKEQAGGSFEVVFDHLDETKPRRYWEITPAMIKTVEDYTAENIEGNPWYGSASLQDVLKDHGVLAFLEFFDDIWTELQG